MKPESYWNYRIMRDRDGLFNIYEVYYRCGKVKNWSSEPASVLTDEVDEIASSLEKMLRGAKEFPVLDHETGEEIA